jgi:hypothetical protein
MSDVQELIDQLRLSGSGEDKVKLIENAAGPEEAAKVLRAHGKEVTAKKVDAYIAGDRLPSEAAARLTPIRTRPPVQPPPAPAGKAALTAAPLPMGRPVPAEVAAPTETRDAPTEQSDNIAKSTGPTIRRGRH